jgi:hypothetical protein
VAQIFEGETFSINHQLNRLCFGIGVRWI